MGMEDSGTGYGEGRAKGRARALEIALETCSAMAKEFEDKGLFHESVAIKLTAFAIKDAAASSMRNGKG